LAGQARGLSFADGEALLDPSRQRYTVRPGDTLGVIAKRTLGDAGRWRELHALNERAIGPNPDRIRPGQVLVLPADAQVAASAAAPEAPSVGPAGATPKVAPKQGAAPAPATKPESGAPPSVETQAGGLAARVASGVKAAPAVQELGQRGKQRFEKRAAPGPKDRVLFAQEDALLGRFEVILSLDGDMSARATQRFLHITSAGGLLIRTPEGMSDLVVHSVVLDLQTMAVRVQSQPEIGPLEHQIISGVLKDTILAQAPELAAKGQGGPLAAAMATLPSDKKGRKVAYDYKALGVSLMSVLLDPAMAATVTFNGKGLNIDMFPGVVVDTPGPDFTIASLRYSFATAAFDIGQQGATTVLGVIGDQLKQPLVDGVEAVGARFFAQKLPAAMRTAGYDPTLDPKFQDNLDTLYANFTGVHLLGGRPGSKGAADKPGEEHAEPAVGGSKAPAPRPGASAGADKKAAPPERQVLYQFTSKDFGPVEVCLEPGDGVKVYKDDTTVGLDAGRGIFLRVPGHEWLQDVRLSAIRYTLATGRLDFEGTERMGEFVRSVLEDVVNAYVLPSLPGDVRRGVGLEGQGDATQQTLYSADVAGAGKVELLLDKGDRLSLSKAEDVVEMSAGRGLVLKAAALPSLAKLRIMKVHYVLGTDELRVDSDNDLGPAGEKLLGQLLKRYVVPQLPGAPAAKADAPHIDKATLAAFPNVAYRQKAGALGTIEARLAGGDTLGVRTDGVVATVYAKAGVLLVVPEASVQLTLQSVSLNTKTGAVDVTASETFGSLERSLLSDIARKFVTPVVERHYNQGGAPQQAPGNADHRVLYHFGDGKFDLDVCLDKGDAVQVEKTDEAITLSAGKGILLRSPKGGLLPESTRVHRVRVDLKDGSVIVDSNPDVGPLGEALGTQVLRELVLPHLPPQLQQFGLAAPKADAVAAATAPIPNPDGLVLLETNLDGVGPFDVSVNGASAMQVEASAGAVNVSAPSGILVRVPGLKLAVRVTHLSVDLQGGGVELTASTPLGAFEQRLLSGLFRMHAMPMVSKYVTSPAKGAGGAGQGDFDVLYGFTADKLGRVSVCVPKGGSVSLQKSDTAISLVAPKGLFFTGVDWLPDFRIQRVDYELGTGKFGIDVSGVAQGRYVEGQDVGPLTEAVVGNLVKALVGPHLPPQAQAIGVVGQRPGAGAAGPPAGATLLKSLSAGSLGDIGIYLDDGDSLSISATEVEGEVRSARGLILDAPALQTRERMRFVKYAFQTGEIQIDGLGALENAVLERALVEFVVPLLPKQHQGETPVGAALGALPQDKKGRRELVAGPVGVAMAPGTRFDVTLDGAGLRFVARPGLHVDGPSIANFELRSVRFAFSERRFRLDLAGDNLIAKALDGVAQRKAEEKLNDMFVPLLPAEMLKPGYDLTKDPHLAETLAGIAQNFAAAKTP
jgi:LysM repeat protein